MYCSIVSIQLKFDVPYFFNIQILFTYLYYSSIYLSYRSFNGLEFNPTQNTHPFSAFFMAFCNFAMTRHFLSSSELEKISPMYSEILYKINMRYINLTKNRRYIQNSTLGIYYIYHIFAGLGSRVHFDLALTGSSS